MPARLLARLKPAFFLFFSWHTGLLGYVRQQHHRQPPYNQSLARAQRMRIRKPYAITF